MELSPRLEALRAIAPLARACLAGKRNKCLEHVGTDDDGLCMAYALEIVAQDNGRAPDRNLEGYFKASCESDLSQL